MSPRINTLRKSRKYRTNWKRPNKWAKFYGSKAWKQLRAQKLQDQPLCENCLSLGIVRAATEVHHAYPFGNGINEEEQWKLLLDYDNLVSLCHQCHHAIHAMMKQSN